MQMSFGAALAWLLEGASIQRRIDLIVDAACAGGLNVLAIRLKPRDIAGLREATDTYLDCALRDEGGQYRGYSVVTMENGISHVEVQSSDGRTDRLELSCDLSRL